MPGMPSTWKVYLRVSTRRPAHEGSPDEYGSLSEALDRVCDLPRRYHALYIERPDGAGHRRTRVRQTMRRTSSAAGFVNSGPMLCSAGYDRILAQKGKDAL